MVTWLEWLCYIWIHHVHSWPNANQFSCCYFYWKVTYIHPYLNLENYINEKLLIKKRYYIIAKPLNIKTITYKTTGLLILAVLVKVLFFTIVPLIGWSRYSLELSLIQCGVEWAERSWNVQSYNFVIFITDYVLPVGLVSFCSYKLIAIVCFIFIQ